MLIKSIRKMNTGKYQILFVNGDKLVTYDEVIIKNNILYKKELSSKEINDIQSLNSFYDVYNNTLKYILKKMKSIKEINEYLKKYDLSDSDKNKIIDKLKNNNMLNDEKFVKAYIYDKVYLSNYGPYKIKKELIRHNIDESLIDSEIDKIDKEEFKKKLIRLINKKLILSKTSNYNTRQKIYSEMQNLGYSIDMIDTCFINKRDDYLFLKKEYTKLYNNLSKKEQDINKINLKIKQKLYQKGYSLSDIDKVISENN